MRDQGKCHMPCAGSTLRFRDPRLPSPPHLRIAGLFASGHLKSTKSSSKKTVNVVPTREDNHLGQLGKVREALGATLQSPSRALHPPINLWRQNAKTHQKTRKIGKQKKTRKSRKKGWRVREETPLSGALLTTPPISESTLESALGSTFGGFPKYLGSTFGGFPVLGSL